MEALSKKTGNSQKKRDGVRSTCLTDSSSESRETSFSGSSSSVSTTEEVVKAKGSSSLSPPLGWPILKATVSSKRSNSDEKENTPHKSHLEDTKFTSIDLKMPG